jgi:hypothetical protein
MTEVHLLGSHDHLFDSRPGQLRVNGAKADILVNGKKVSNKILDPFLDFPGSLKARLLVWIQGIQYRDDLSVLLREPDDTAVGCVDHKFYQYHQAKSQQSNVQGEAIFHEVASDLTFLEAMTARLGGGAQVKALETQVLPGQSSQALEYCLGGATPTHIHQPSRLFEESLLV